MFAWYYVMAYICITKANNMKKVYPKKVKAAYIPTYVNGQINPALANQPAKKVNPANFMTAETFAKSKYATMSDSDFAEERRRDAMNSISW